MVAWVCSQKLHVAFRKLLQKCTISPPYHHGCWLINFIPKPRLSLLASFIVSKKKFLIRPHDSFLLCLIYVFPLIGAVNDGLRHLNMCINKDVV